MRSVRSAKKTALKRLSSSFDLDETSSSDNSSSSDSFDFLPNSLNAGKKKGLDINSEEDIILVEYELPSSPESKKKDTKRRKFGKRSRNDSNDHREEEVDEKEKIAEAIVIDFDTPTRKLEVESRVFLNKIDIFQIPEIFNTRQVWRFQRLEKISQANLKRRSIDEVLLEEEEEEERRSQSRLNLKPPKRVRFE